MRDRKKSPILISGQFGADSSNHISALGNINPAVTQALGRKSFTSARVQPEGPVAFAPSFRKTFFINRARL